MVAGFAPAREKRRARNRGYTATLSCGMVLEYEVSSFLPAIGQLVPCRKHGYCIVEVSERRDGRSRGDLVRAKARSQDELLEWLQQHPVTTIHILRRHRFSLRMLAAAQRDGHLTVDPWSGYVDARRSHCR